jgi:hypothetical protein
MTEKIKKTIDEQISKMPATLQEAVNSFDWIAIVYKIGEENKLLDEDINIITLETVLVMSNLIEPESFAKYIEDQIGFSKEDCIAIAKEIDLKVFKPISRKITEKIKDNLKNKTPDTQQNLNFVLSGGDYSAFVEQPGSRSKFADTMKNLPPITPVRSGNPPKKQFTILTLKLISF